MYFVFASTNLLINQFNVVCRIKSEPLRGDNCCKAKIIKTVFSLVSMKLNKKTLLKISVDSKYFCTSRQNQLITQKG